jgi:hypothetical protein
MSKLLWSYPAVHIPAKELYMDARKASLVT